MRRYIQSLAYRIPIPILCNLFMLWNRLYGISGTVKRIQRLSILPSQSSTSVHTDINKVSRRIDWWCHYTPYLIYSNRQKCLVRGYFLYYWSRCHGIPLELVIGAAAGELAGELNGSPDWHCWIEKENCVLYEVPDVIEKYQEFIRYV